MKLYGSRTDFAAVAVGPAAGNVQCNLPQAAPEGRLFVRVTVCASRGAGGLATVVVPYLPTTFTAPGIDSGSPYPTGEVVEVPEESVGRVLNVSLPVTTAQETAAGWTWQGSVLVEAFVR